MGAQPGTPAAMMPYGEDYVQRMLEDIRRDTRDQLATTVMRQAEVNANLAAKQAYLESLISRDAGISTFNIPTLTNDSNYHLTGSQIVVSDVPVPTGKVRITLSCSEATTFPGTNSVIVGLCYAIDGPQTLDPTQRYARLYTSSQPIGSSLSRTDTEVVTPGTYTVRAQAFYWSAGTATASANFTSPRLLVEVIGAD